jgi:hypothetical protein
VINDRHDYDSINYINISIVASIEVLRQFFRKIKEMVQAISRSPRTRVVVGGVGNEKVTVPNVKSVIILLLNVSHQVRKIRIGSTVANPVEEDPNVSSVQLTRPKSLVHRIVALEVSAGHFRECGLVCVWDRCYILLLL